MARAVYRPLFTALLISGLIHLLLLGVGEPWWRLPRPELSFPIEASLVPPEPPTVEAPPARRVPPPKPVRETIPARPLGPPEPPAPPPSAAVAEPRVAEPVETRPDPVETRPEPVEPPPVAVAPPPVAEPPVPAKPPPAPERKAVRSLPEELKITYAVQVGDDGFVAGRATYIWHSRNGRYSLVNTVEATGLAALFISGRIVQLSEGVVDGYGLRPEQYWLQRNQRKQDTARFNWPLNQLTLGGNREGQALTPQAQDMLSFPFQLALTARADEGEFSMGVTNGQRFKEYQFRSLGKERLTLAGREVEALHLQGRREGEGTLDVWLDPRKGGVPVRIKTLDTKGKVFVLELEPGSVAGERQ